MNPLHMMGYGDVSLEQLVEQIHDPKTKMLAQMMLKQKEAAAQHTADPEPRQKPEGSMDVRLQQDVKKLVSLHRQLLQDHRELQAKHLRLEQVHQYVADALGACTCLGLDPACTLCQGAGKPGSREINEAAYMQVIQPFLDLLLRNQPDDEPSTTV